MSSRTGVVLALLSIVALAAWLRLFHLDQGHPGLSIYSATSSNAITSWRDWFYPSLYPDGGLLMDKPPVYFWLQGISIAVLGAGNLGLRLPAALAGILAVVFLYAIVKRGHGPMAGLLAALALAVMPLSVNFSRGVFLEPVAGLAMLVATYFVVRGVNEKRESLLYVAAAVMGVGFMTKLWQGLLPMPALALFLMANRWTPWTGLARTLGIAGGVFLASALWWPVAVWLTSGQYDGVMHASNIWDMIFGWNLLDRFGGLDYGGSFNRTDFAWFVTGPMSLLFGISLPLALIGVMASAPDFLGRGGLRGRGGQGVLWTGWLVVGLVGFGNASVKLASYWDSVAPAVAALSGIGVVYLINAREREGIFWWVFAFVLSAGFGYCAFAFHRVSDVEGYFRIAYLVSIALAFLVPLVIAMGKGTEEGTMVVWAIGIAAAGFMALSVVVPLHNIFKPRSDTLGYVGFDMVFSPNDAPSTYPIPRGQVQGIVITAIARASPEALDKAMDYLEANRGGAEYLVAADSYNTSAKVAFLTGGPVLTLYSEYQDRPITDIATLERLAGEGRVRYILTSREMRLMDPVLYIWMVSHCEDVSREAGLDPRGEMRLLKVLG